MKKTIKTITLLILSSLTLLLISCNDDDNTKVSSDKRCTLPDISTISEEHLLIMENLTTNVRLKSPLFITWGPEKRILQVYENGEIMNEETEHTPQCPGVEMDLENKLYEFKLWKPGATLPEVSLWVNVVDKIEYFYKGVQFDKEKDNWLTVPGDGCEPAIADYQKQYTKYVTLDNNTSSKYSQLGCHADQLKIDRGVNGKIHNITYLEKSYPNILEGVHTASYSFQIPSLETGRTVEGGFFIWIGGETRLDYGTAFQLILDDTDEKYEKLYYWYAKDGEEKWIYSDKKVKIYNDFFYKVTYTLDYNTRYASILFEGKDEFYFISDIISETTKDKTWTDKTVARFQAESISRDGKNHKVNFKNYTWSHYFCNQEDKKAMNDERATSSLVTTKQFDKELKTDIVHRNSSGDENVYSANFSKFSCENPVWKKANRDDEFKIVDNELDGKFDVNSFSWKEFILSHRKFLVKFDNTSDKFDDSKYSGENDPMGTLKGEETYSVIYTSMGFTCTGFNQGTDSIGTWTYSNADPSEKKISLWGRVYEFTESGHVHDIHYGHVGYLFKAE